LHPWYLLLFICFGPGYILVPQDVVNKEKDDAVHENLSHVYQEKGATLVWLSEKPFTAARRGEIGGDQESCRLGLVWLVMSVG